MAGVIDSGGTALGFMQVVVPAAGKNYVTNPSFETNTTGWTPTSATLVRTSGGNVAGTFRGQLLASGANGRADFALPQLTAGLAAVASIYLQADSASIFLQFVQDAAIVEQAHPGDGLVHRIEVTATVATATTRSLRVVDKRTGSWTNVYLDGAQYEYGSVASTYIDGDQDGCSWDGGQHASTSTRDGRDGRGGTIVSFDSLDLIVQEAHGAGTPPLELQTEARALTDGSIYRQTRVAERILTLIATLQSNGTPVLHQRRRALLDTFNPNGRANRGPTLLRYAQSDVPKVLECYYEGGLELEQTHVPAFEPLAIRFRATDPDWKAELQQSSAINGQQTLSGVRLVMQRDKYGAWSNLAGGLVGIGGAAVYALALGFDGSLYAAGSFTSASGGAASAYLARWDGTQWNKVGTSGPNSTVLDIAIAPNGDVAIVGDFGVTDAVAGSVRVAYWDGAAWHAFAGAGANVIVRSAAYDTFGRLWVVGDFTSIGGVSANYGAWWDGSWHAANLPAPGEMVRMGPDGVMYATSGLTLYKWTGSWTVLATAVGTTALRLFWDKSRLYGFGTLSSIGGVAANNIGSTPFGPAGTGWAALATGVGSGGGTFVNQLSEGPDGVVHAAGRYTQIGPLTTSAPLGAWQGSSWYLDDVIPPPGNDAYPQATSVLAHPDGKLTVGLLGNGGTNTNATVPGVATITNPGSATSFPVFKFTVAGYIYSLVNLTTGQAIRTSALIASGETPVLDLRPGRKSFRSQSRDLMPFVLPGSDLETFGLAPGANQVAFFASDASSSVAFSYRPRYLSVD